LELNNVVLKPWLPDRSAKTSTWNAHQTSCCQSNSSSVVGLELNNVVLKPWRPDRTAKTSTWNAHSPLSCKRSLIQRHQDFILFMTRKFYENCWTSVLFCIWLRSRKWPNSTICDILILVYEVVMNLVWSFNILLRAASVLKANVHYRTYIPWPCIQVFIFSFFHNIFP
jgi:hypothetical protein